MKEILSVLPPLVCPRCLVRLTFEATLTCAHCNVTYTKIRGKPVLIDKSTSLFDPDKIVANGLAQPTYKNKFTKVFHHLVPSVYSNLASHSMLELLRKNLVANTRPLLVGGHRFVLVIGSGPSSKVQWEESDQIQVVNCDISAFEIVDVICDAHQLPFEDGVFDAVVIMNVLEHVHNPQRVVDEIARVLSSSGLVYAQTPFIQQVHGGEYDYQRFTQIGHRFLFAEFRSLDHGIQSGPGTALAWTIYYYFRSWSNRVVWQRLSLMFVSHLFWWLRILDKWLSNQPSSADAAAEVYFFGEKVGFKYSPRQMQAEFRS